MAWGTRGSAEGRARRAEVEDVADVIAAGARFLEVRPRAVSEVQRHLVEAGYPVALVEAAVARLLELGYLDDEAFARAWVESRDRAHPRGARAIRSELRRKGVAVGDVESALAAREATATDEDPDDPARGLGDGERAGSAASDEAAARRLLERRAAALGREADPRKRRSKAYALLARNGFDPSTAARVAAAWEAPTADEPEDDEA
jgi:regulatory protein